MPKANPAPPFDPLGRQLNVTARATRALLDSVLAEAGTTFSNWLVLAALSTLGPSIQKDLANELDVIGPSIGERLDQLEAAGQVLRSRVPGDRRAYLVSLTPAGHALFSQLNATMLATEAALIAGVTPREIQTTRRVLAQIAERARTLRATS